MKLFSALLALALLVAVPASAATVGQFTENRSLVTATIVIADSTTISPAINLGGTRLVGIYIPAEFDGTALTFTASATIDGTYVAVDVDHTSASAYTVTSTASRYVPLINPDVMRGLKFIKIVTSSAQTTTNTVFTLVTLP